MSTNNFRWFVLYITSAIPEYNFFLNTIVPFLKNIKKEDIDAVELDIICIAKKKNASELIENRIIKIRDRSPYYKEKVIEKDITLEKLMDNLTKTYNGIMLSSHSNGVTIGSDKYPVIETVDLIQLCKNLTNKRKKKLDFFVADCCYMGSIEPLYELTNITEYILATPSYHDGKYSFLQSPEIFKKYKDKVIWLSKFSNWYVSLAEKYTHKLDHPIQWTVYSAPEVKKLGDYLIKSKLLYELVFRKSSVIYWNDTNLHNFRKVIENTIKKKPDLKGKLNRLLLLYLKSFLYYSNSGTCSLICKFKTCPMSIHSSLPPYLDDSLNCRLELFSKIYCKTNPGEKIDNKL